MSRTVAIISARLSSTRLPGKVLLDLLGKPMLERQIERLKFCRNLSDIVLATTTLPEDAEILTLAARLGLPSYAGSPDDVLDRYYQAAKRSGVSVIARITADCPMIDPDVTDSVVELFARGRLDHASTGDRFPDGLDTEVFSFAALKIAWEEAALTSEREHVTPFIWKNPGRFKLAALAPKENLSSLRWTVDEPRDFVFVETIYKRLHREGHAFGMADVLALLEKEPTLAEINGGILRNEGYAKSLAHDLIMIKRNL